MSHPSDHRSSPESAGKRFADEGSRQKDGNVVSELLAFLAHNKKWWLLPIIVTILLMGLLILLGGSGAAPFIYTLF